MKDALQTKYVRAAKGSECAYLERSLPDMSVRHEREGYCVMAFGYRFVPDEMPAISRLPGVRSLPQRRAGRVTVCSHAGVCIA